MIPLGERKMMMPIHEQHRTASVHVIEPEAPRVNVVYFPRFGGGSLEFMAPAQTLAQVGCRVSCLEYLGHANSEWLPAEQYGPGHDVQFARTLLAAQDDLPLLIIGNGWGGHIALQAMSASPDTPAGIVLFDYVNAFRFSTDIVMPFEAQVAEIVATSRAEFEQRVAEIARPLGQFGSYLAKLSVARAQDVGEFVSLRVDPAAFRPFSEDPDRIVRSGHMLGQAQCDVMVVNGRLAQFKNLQMPPRSGPDFPDGLRFIGTERMGYFDWHGKAAAGALVGYLREKNLVEAKKT